MANEERKLPGIGVFGTGFRARAMVHLLNIHGFQITQVWDTNKIEAEKMAGKLNGASTSDKIDDVLLNSKVEMAVVCCKPHLQAQIAMKTLRLGKKVVCDPPAGTDASETRKVLDAATYYPSLMSSANYYLRFLPTFQCIKRFIEVYPLCSCEKGYMRAKNNKLLGKQFLKNEDEDDKLLEDSNEIPK